MALPEYTPAMQPKNNTPRDELIVRYFRQGYTNKEISQVLPDIVEAMLKIMENSGKCLGYRRVWKRLTTEYGIAIQPKTVMELMCLIDPDGVARRKNRKLIRCQYTSPGPNFVWHVDGYNKLNPFGFAIHGAINRFSRRILWLEVGPSNNDPQIIVRYFLDAVKQL